MASPPHGDKPSMYGTAHIFSTLQVSMCFQLT